ncbi:hypothetical protein QBC34DRAFT_423937 [Podospora aff. communis PSN243]|uniref:Uncharacterized protein n=1 Tax=Podospora aff. communis PSN243 TaxID=3040156 RepID=A0AAV9GU76_9PEZI|nr:hypothetical protein QBC34DRAFT_423937 [Podospora aff. communis PSN243]
MSGIEDILKGLAGFSGLQSPSDRRLSSGLKCAKPFSSVNSGAKEIVLNNLIVLVRLVVWHLETRADRKIGQILTECWGVEFDDIKRTRFSLMHWLDCMMTARSEYLKRNVSVPPTASETERRLLSLVDELRLDIARHGKHPRASTFALERRPRRASAWRQLLRSNPKALLVRNPDMGSVDTAPRLAAHVVPDYPNSVLRDTAASRNSNSESHDDDVHQSEDSEPRNSTLTPEPDLADYTPEETVDSSQIGPVSAKITKEETEKALGEVQELIRAAMAKLEKIEDENMSTSAQLFGDRLLALDKIAELAEFVATMLPSAE